MWVCMEMVQNVSNCHKSAKSRNKNDLPYFVGVLVIIWGLPALVWSFLGEKLRFICNNNFDLFLICGNLRRFVWFPYKLLNFADVIIMQSVPMSLIMHSVQKKNSLIYAQLSTLAWAACDGIRHLYFLSTQDSLWPSMLVPSSTLLFNMFSNMCIFFTGIRDRS